MNPLFVQLGLALFSLFIVNVTGNICRVSCDVDFVTIGCYKDLRSNRALPAYIYQERDRRLKKNFGNREIEWYNWNVYYPGFACRCAQKAKEFGYDLFGLQFYGECWAGHSHQHNYAKHGKASRPGRCIQDDYQPCKKSSRYCMGTSFHNMVYQIVDASCPQVPFEKVGCFNDLHVEFARPLPDYIFNDRDPSIENFSGQRVDWVNWDIYVPHFACRCAAAAKARNHTFFGMQFYGECWSGGDSNVEYDKDGISLSKCVDPCYEPCTEQSKFCSGKNFANYVYRIKGPCEVSITPVGCYKEDLNDLAMQEIFYNEADPEKPNFAGNVLPESSVEYEAEFPDFLCKCARKAHENKWEYFGVRDLGLCVRSSPTITNYDKYGSSDQCIEGNSAKTCVNGSKLCTGKDTAANYVYKVSLNKTVRVTLVVYSGLVDPQWKAVLSLLDYESIQSLGYSPDCIPAKLYYKGFLVQDDGREVLIVGAGDASTEIVRLQRLLLQTMPTRMIPASLQHRVLVEIGHVPTACPKAKRKRHAPVYNPAKWNANANTRRKNNCYNYANIRITNTFAQPGRGSGPVFQKLKGVSVRDAAVRDGALVMNRPTAPAGPRHLMALFIDPGVDFHWYRLDKGRRWSHKPGSTRVTQNDQNGKKIKDPRRAATGNYKFVAFMTSNSKTVKIK